MFHLLAGTVALFAVYVAMMKDGTEGLRRGWWVASLLIPTWLCFRVGPIALGGRDVAGAVGLVLLVVFPRKDGQKIRFVPMPSDFAVFALFLVCTISKHLAGLFTALTLVDLAREWLLPYIVGRFFLQRSDDIKQFIPFAMKIYLAVACLNIFEGLVQMNLMAKITGERFGLLESGEGYRWGVKRAHCNTMHPIYNGLVCCMLFPWSIQAFNLRKHCKKRLWLVMPLIAGVGAFFTASRGPHAALIISIGIITFFRLHRLRIPLAVVGGGTLLLIALFAHQIKEFAGSLEGKKEADYQTFIMIDGEQHEYTGTKHRDLLNLVYEQAIDECPWFGYGLKMKGIPIEEHLIERFWSIDNHYLLFFLQNGHAGHVAFLSVSVCVVLQALTCAFNVRDGRSILACGIAATGIGVGLLIKSVWFSPCYGQIWLFQAGLSACLMTVKDDEKGRFKVKVKLKKLQPKRSFAPADRLESQSMADSRLSVKRN